MTIVEAIRIALLSLWANKLRSVLTLLGVVIGIASVIAVVTFVNGINGYVAEKIFNLGANSFIVSKQPNVVTDVDEFIEDSKHKDLTMDEYRAVAEGCSCMQGSRRQPAQFQWQSGLRDTEQHRHMGPWLDAQHGPDLRPGPGGRANAQRE